jgi:L-alanine-DL-glutamate epimerase-like enolase superfamily enzyme
MGFECALFDAWAKQRGCTVQQLLYHDTGAAATPTRPQSFYTAALNDVVSKIVDSARFGTQYTPLLKIKLDGNVARSRTILAALYAFEEQEAKEEKKKTGNAAAAAASAADAAAAPCWSIDANAAWTPRIAMDHLQLLEQYKTRVFMVEQPFPLLKSHDGTTLYIPGGSKTKKTSLNKQELAAEFDAWKRVKQAYEAAGILIYGDESIAHVSDVLALRPILHGVNVKLEKSGGFRNALRVIRTARAHGLRVWIGIMVGSILNSRAAASLLPLAYRGYGDVDGALLTVAASSLFSGGFAWRSSGFLQLSEAPGFGLTLKPTYATAPATSMSSV